MNFRQLTRAQQNYARRLRERGWRVGISESVSQIAKDLGAFERLIEAAEQRAAAERAAAEQQATTMSTREYAAARGISIRTAQRWAAAGKIPAAKNAQGRWAITINA